MKLSNIFALDNFDNPISCTKAHPSLDGHSRKIMTRELVYYILLGTLRSAQKCLWSNLRADFLGEKHFFLIYTKLPNQTMQLMG